MGKMGIMVLAGLVFVTVALVVYSLGVWGAFRKKGASKRDILFLWIGFAGDVLGTLMMAIQPVAAVVDKLKLNPSAYLIDMKFGDNAFTIESSMASYVALAAMALMLVCIIFVVRASAAKDDRLAATMSRVIVAPWVLWVTSFVMMSIDKMPKRG